MCCETPARRPERRRALAAWPRLALALGLALGLGLGAAGCGNKRPPKAPPRMVPATTTDLLVGQRGSELQFSFTYPAATVAGLPLAGLEAVELWRLTRPLVPPPADDDDTDEEESGDEADDDDAPEESLEQEEPPSAARLLFRRPAGGPRIQAEQRVEADPIEFSALAELAQRIEGPELGAALSGDRVLLRLPLGELPPSDVPEDERDLEIFAVRTVSTRGLDSTFSNLVKILPRTPPAPPSQIEVRPGADGINVVWEGEDPAVGFRVYRRDAASRSYPAPLAVPVPDARSHLDGTAVFDSRYVYTVTTVSLQSPLVESALAAEREVQYEDRYPPAAPGGLIALAEPGRVRLLWEPSGDDDLAGYLVYRRAPDGAAFERLADEPRLELEYLDEAVASGRGYSYYVSAIDRSGNESEASETVDVEIP